MSVPKDHVWRQRAGIAAAAKRVKPRPAWMEDPSLLPKSPPPKPETSDEDDP